MLLEFGHVDVKGFPIMSIKKIVHGQELFLMTFGEIVAKVVMLEIIKLSKEGLYGKR